MKICRCACRLNRFVTAHSGASAVEFALVMPVLLIIVFGIVIFGAYLAMTHAVQQLAAEAARSSVAGLSETERSSLANAYVTTNATSYPLIASDHLSVIAATSSSDANVFVVTVNYDASGMFIFTLPTFLPKPPTTIVRSAAIPRGGY